jgi:hypothetical protein
MTNFAENSEELEEVKNQLEDFQSDWRKAQEEFKDAKEAMNSEDLLSTIDYLGSCDQLRKEIFFDLNEIDSILTDLSKLKNALKDKEHLNIAETLKVGFEDLKKSKIQQNEFIDEEYTSLSEETLRKAQDLIAKSSEATHPEGMIPNISDEINQSLEKELLLQELKDSLESYRELREEYITELLRESDKKGFQDLGRENSEIDSVLSELDTAITACDLVLLNKEITS